MTEITLKNTGLLVAVRLSFKRFFGHRGFTPLGFFKVQMLSVHLFQRFLELQIIMVLTSSLCFIVVIHSDSAETAQGA